MTFAMQSAPDFTLLDTDGNSIRLSFLRGKCNVLLVFLRGFSCPFSRQQLASLRKDIDQFQLKKTVVLIIAPERPDQVKSYWDQELFPFLGLADPDHEVANTYRQQSDMYRKGRMPAVLLLDEEGGIRWSHYGSSPADMPSTANLLAEVDKLLA